MPAHDWEVKEAQAEGITLHDGWGVHAFSGDGRVQHAELKACSAVFDPTGRFAPQYNESKRKMIDCDVVIVAAGMSADTDAFGLRTNGNRTLAADPGTLQTEVPYVFAAGDVVTGPTMITTAVGQGRRAAFMIDRYLQGQDLKAGRQPLPRVPAGPPRRKVVPAERQEVPHLPPEQRRRSFAEMSQGYTLEQALAEAQRCLNCGFCSECMQCVKACQAGAICHEAQDEHLELDVGAIILAPGYDGFAPKFGEDTA